MLGSTIKTDTSGQTGRFGFHFRVGNDASQYNQQMEITQSNSVVAVPIHDPDGIMLSRFQAITPQMKQLFGRAYVSVTAVTHTQQPCYVEWLNQDDFFIPLYLEERMPVGVRFLTLYETAVAANPPDTLLHLCFQDRLIFALYPPHRAAFMADMQAITPAQTPLTYLRSDAAWATHPDSYEALEKMLRRTGEMIFGKVFDFAWCHMAVLAGQLQSVLPHIRHADISMLAEITLALRRVMQNKAVDWLAWEDPFILQKDAATLKAAREKDMADVRKRLAYVIPILTLLQNAAQNGESPFSDFG